MMPRVVGGVLSLLFYNLATVNYGQTCDAVRAEDINGLAASIAFP